MSTAHPLARPDLARQAKACVTGTHRARTAAETWEWIQLVLPRVGITRVAEVTWLDEIGIPVFQAVRPDSWLLCVSQGKGLTRELARVSAAMEGIEFWHGERIHPGERIATARELAGELTYSIGDLDRPSRSAVHDDMPLEWTQATGLASGRPTWLPTAMLRMDTRTGPGWTVPTFRVSSNGLAGGNTGTEAALHALCEVVERNALTRAHRSRHTPVLDPATVTGPAAGLIDTFQVADVEVRMRVLPTPVGLPCFQARIWSESIPLHFSGTGCHPDREVALCRALTEAAQCRATVIAGARDDLSGDSYGRAEAGIHRRPPAEEGGMSYAQVPSAVRDDLDEDLRDAVDRVTAVTGREPVLADHTRPDIGVPVVHVVCPALPYDGVDV